MTDFLYTKSLISNYFLYINYIIFQRYDFTNFKDMIFKKKKKFFLRFVH